MTKSRSSMTVFVLCCVGLTAEASPILTAICEPPDGPRVDYGLKSDEAKPQESRDRINEMNPTFVLDSSKKGVISVIWGPTVIRGLSKEVVPATRAQDVEIVLSTEDQITAIEPYQSGLYTYSLFPKLGFGIFTRMSNSSGSAAGYMMYSKCRFAL